MFQELGLETGCDIRVCREEFDCIEIEHWISLMDTLIVFDFDWSLIDCNSDTWVVDKLGASNLMRSLRHILPWTQLMVLFLALPLFGVHVRLLFSTF